MPIEPPDQPSNGEPADSREAMAALYDILRAIAQDQMRSERAGHTLQATAVVHEAYLRVADVGETIWRDRNHFLSVAASTIRRVLVDHARGRDRLKRGGGDGPITLQTGAADARGPTALHTVDVLALDEALRALAARDEQAARLVELRFFGGLTIEEAADLLGIGRNTATRRWRAARAWLKAAIGPESDRGHASPDGEAGDG